MLRLNKLIMQLIKLLDIMKILSHLNIFIGYKTGSANSKSSGSDRNQHREGCSNANGTSRANNTMSLAIQFSSDPIEVRANKEDPIGY